MSCFHRKHLCISLYLLRTCYYLSPIQVCVTFVFSALLEYALVNYASRSDAQRLAKKKHQKQWEIDHCSFDPEAAGDGMQPPPPGVPPPPPPMGPGAGQNVANNGGSFAMVMRTTRTWYKGEVF